MITKPETARSPGDVAGILKALQQDVQRNLGRCMLRLQQYERLLKGMVAEVAVEGPFQDLHGIREKIQSKLRNKTLGALVGEFTETYLKIELAEGKVDSKDDSAAFVQDTDVAWMSMRYSLAMPPEIFTQTKDNLAELVALRNDLVHHLIDQFDLSNDSGCRAAVTHLDTCYERIDGHCARLRDWATGLAETRALASSYLQSKAFEDMLVHGINPDGTVRWPQSTIVEYLREAETAFQVEGWTSLDVAIGFISKVNRDQVPSRYGCKNWRQVLRKSGLFEIRCPGSADGAIGKAWYRSRPEVQGSP